MNQQHPHASVIDPIRPTIETVMLLLFKPFDVGKGLFAIVLATARPQLRRLHRRGRNLKTKAKKQNVDSRTY